MASKVLDILVGIIPIAIVLPFLTGFFGTFGAVKKTYRNNADNVQLTGVPTGKNVNLTLVIELTVGGTAVSNNVLQAGFVSAPADPITTPLFIETYSAGANQSLKIVKTVVLDADVTQDWRSLGEGRYLRVSAGSGVTVNRITATFWS